MRDRARLDGGYTLVEMLVTLLIVGILTAVAVPIALSQRTRGWDASVQSDLRRLGAAADKFYTTDFTYPTTLKGFADNGKSVTLSDSNAFRAYVIRSGADAGYVIYAMNKNSQHVFVLSSYDETEPTRTTLTALPETPPAGGTFGVDADIRPSDWASTAGLDPEATVSTRQPFTDPTFANTTKDVVNASNIPLVGPYYSGPFRITAVDAPVSSRGVEVVTDSSTKPQGVILFREAYPGAWSSAQTPVVAAGESWTVSAWVKAPSGTDMLIGCRFIVPATSTYVREATASFTGTGTWQRASLTCVTATGDIGSYVVPQVDTRVLVPGTTFWVTAPQVEKGAKLSPFAVK